MAAAPAGGGPARRRSRDTAASRSSSRRTASAWRTCSTSRPARDPRRRPAPRDRRPQRRDRPSLGLRELAAVRLHRRLHVRRRCARWPSAGPRPSRWTATCCASCSARRSCASCSIPTRSRTSSSASRPSSTSGTPTTRTRSTTCCGGSATSRPTRWGTGPAGGRRRGLAPPRRARGIAARGPGEDRRRGALDRDGGRRAVPGRRRGIGAARRAAGVPRARRSGRSTGCSPAMPGRTGRSSPPTRRAAGACRSAWSRTRSTAWSPRAPCSAASSGPAAPSASTATPRSCGSLRRRSLAKLRREVEPVDPITLARFLPAWQGVAPSPSAAASGSSTAPRAAGPSASSGWPRSSTSWPACRSRPPSSSGTCSRPGSPGYQPRLLDELGAMGEVAWVGRGSLGRDDGRVVLYRPGRELLRPTGPPDGVERPADEIHERLRAHLRRRGACFYRELFTASGGRARPRGARRALGPRLGRRGHQRHVRPAAGAALEAAGEGPPPAPRPAHRARAAGGRGSLVAGRTTRRTTLPRRGARAPPARSAPMRQALALLERHGVADPRGGRGRGRSTAGSRPSIRSCARWRRPAGSGAATSSTGWAPRSSRCPGAVDRLRAMRDQPGELAGDHGRVVHLLAAADPANPYGAALAVAPPRRRRPAPVPASSRRVRGAGRRRRRRSTWTAAGRRSRRCRPPTIQPSLGAALASLARPRRRRPGPRARHRQGRRRARRRVAGPRRAARRRLRRGLPRVLRSRPRERPPPGRCRCEAPCPRATRSPAPPRDCVRTWSAARSPAARARAPGPQVGAARRIDGHGRRGDGQEPADPVRQRARGPDPPPDARLVAPLPAGRALAPAPGPGVARDRGAGLGRRLLRRPGRRAVRAADGGAAPVALEARAGPARRPGRHRRGDAPAPRPGRATTSTIAEALLDQRAMAGIGNEIKNLVLWEARRSPWTRLRDVDDAALRRLIDRAIVVLREGAATGRRPPGVHGRAGRPCPRCGTIVQAKEQGRELPRLTYWCPACQPHDPRGDQAPTRPPT